LKVFLSRRAKAALEDLPTTVRKRIETSIAELVETPFPAGCKKLRDAPNSYRLRVGDYRILYNIVERDEILVFRIAPRESVYE